ncbi:hypothetical protein CbuD7D7780_09740 [Coxiella burnetii]|uniref:Hypothetical membrane spanning protein n=1 Tax=Coxiella burnetii (strain Dugway 5J108-111) TaxID=434922 RepID=A9KD57_COXBN|nr:Dot/Icm T4SS effector ElpA [Coxiella burnetii]ABS77435.2 hypothetical membrane spanning protein [Coxiella burnetii Dugway 5J108-111]OYK79376.1 hypothetical protein CbuD7E6568_09720 [Coxiella burnetii]OYK81458.1 hypothetical protein CbuD7D7780_09740 [Coxiella burnetii]
MVSRIIYDESEGEFKFQAEPPDQAFVAAADSFKKVVIVVNEVLDRVYADVKSSEVKSEDDDLQKKITFLNNIVSALASLHENPDSSLYNIHDISALVKEEYKVVLTQPRDFFLETPGMRIQDPETVRSLLEMAIWNYLSKTIGKIFQDEAASAVRGCLCQWINPEVILTMAQQKINRLVPLDAEDADMIVVYQGDRQLVIWRGLPEPEEKSEAPSTSESRRLSSLMIVFFFGVLVLGIYALTRSGLNANHNNRQLERLLSGLFASLIGIVGIMCSVQYWRRGNDFFIDLARSLRLFPRQSEVDLQERLLAAIANFNDERNEREEEEGLEGVPEEDPEHPLLINLQEGNNRHHNLFSLRAEEKSREGNSGGMVRQTPFLTVHEDRLVIRNFDEGPDKEILLSVKNVFSQNEEEAPRFNF